jgi:ribose 5-phosphate isomerase A
LNLSQQQIDQEKKNAAYAAVKHVMNRFVVGLGSGSTAALAITALGERVKKEKLQILGVPTSYQAFQVAVASGIQITTLEEHPIVDITIDGADQLTPQLYLIKGGGAALAREKIVAASSKLNVIIADQQKKAKLLGENNQTVPVEVLPFAQTLAKQKISLLGGKIMVREAKGKLGPILTDNGNVVFDVNFGAVAKPAELDAKVKLVTGVVETGFFVGLTDIAYVGVGDKVEKIERKRTKP